MSMVLRALMVEDSIDDCIFINRELKKAGFELEWKQVYNERDLSQALEQENWDIILSDHIMPGFSSLEALDVVNRSRLDIPFIIVSGLIADESAVEAMKAGCRDYVSKDSLARLPAAISREIGEARMRQAKKNTELELNLAFFDLAETVARVVELKDPYTAGHQRRVASMCRQIGLALQMSQQELEALYFGGLLHDIGKVGIPSDILSKPNALSNAELAVIREHPSTGFEIIKNAHLPWNISEIILHHHEKLDGSGYPHGLCAPDISLSIRIISICDVVEAMSTFRPYRPALPQSAVIQELLQGMGTKYDPDVTRIMIDLIEKNNSLMRKEAG